MKVKCFWWTVAAIAVVRLVLMAVTPVFEPSEARYAAISANMARSGDFVVPHFTHNLEYQSFDGKPPLVFQAGGLFCRAIGLDAPWKLQLGVRLFPFLSAGLLLLILYHSVKRLADADTGRLAVLVCAGCTAFYAAAGLSMTDMSLTCCVAGALLLYQCFLSELKPGGVPLRYALGVAGLLGAGMIVKGPVSMVMFGLPVLADAIVNRRWKGVFSGWWLAALPVFLLVAVPWFVIVEQRNPGSVWYFFYNENFMRFVSHDYGDKYGAGREAFRGVSIVWAFVSTLPWVLLSPLRKIDWKDFFLVSLLSIVGFWCLTSRVLLYYLFPMIPLFAAWLAVRGDRNRLFRFAVPCAALSVVVTVGALFGGMLFSDKMEGPKTEFSPLSNHYAHEFYHGRRSEAELMKYRAARDAYLKARAARKQAEAAAKKGERKAK